MAGAQEAASLTGKHTGEAGPHITAEELQVEQGPGEVRLGISVARKSYLAFPILKLLGDNQTVDEGKYLFIQSFQLIN